MGSHYMSAMEHEGNLVGVVPEVNQDGRPSDWRFRELRAANLPTYDGDRGTIPIQHLHAHCSCGWRSPRLDASYGAIWEDGWIQVSESCEARAMALWTEHVASEIARQHGTLTHDDTGLRSAIDALVGRLGRLLEPARLRARASA